MNESKFCTEIQCFSGETVMIIISNDIKENEKTLVAVQDNPQIGTWGG